MPAEVKKPIKALGEKITGLKAGTKYVFVLPKQKAKLDNAKSTTTNSRSSAESGAKLQKLLTQAHAAMKRGDKGQAKTFFDQARQVFSAVEKTAKEAEAFAKAAASDVESAVEETKQAYEAGKKAADAAHKNVDGIVKAGKDAIRAFGALFEETKSR
jgi:hypothetical protein